MQEVKESRLEIERLAQKHGVTVEQMSLPLDKFQAVVRQNEVRARYCNKTVNHDKIMNASLISNAS